jgi:hypothetical protein
MSEFLYNEEGLLLMPEKPLRGTIHLEPLWDDSYEIKRRRERGVQKDPRAEWIAGRESRAHKRKMRRLERELMKRDAQEERNEKSTESE